MPPSKRKHSKPFEETTRQPALRHAWNKVHANGIQSRSDTTKTEIIEFQKTADKIIRKIQREIRNGSFVFGKSVGKKVPKGSMGDFRPIVVAPIETRILQRAVLDQLLRQPSLKPYIVTPYSFGGITKQSDDGMAAVPLAISKILDAKKSGLNYVRCADISAFFTRISKSAVREIISNEIQASDFMGLFDSCVSVELENAAQLGADADRFPREDMGVAQGSALSPLLGNILLHAFDKSMNEGDCACFRYIDDIIILAPTERAANARFRKAEGLLSDLQLEFSAQKSSGGVQSFETGFEFLGIEIVNGLIRPNGKAVGKLKQKILDILNASRKEFSRDASKPFRSQFAMIPTLSRVSGTLNGWAKHYRFCNDQKLFLSLDQYVESHIASYLGSYAASVRKNPEAKRDFLGITSLNDIDWKPFAWPK
ncbi:reverse transcriptase domain-containing protein [Roseibium sp. SCPC15]|uniref:reverse transcriptase domain-containing protein n=1 Tax=Roseibium sp. SCP15 TaxID=3141376 RepID=UPI003336560A